jgi:hypothetical protein
VAKVLLQKLTQCRDALRPGRIERVQLHRQILRGQLLYRFLASVGLARRQYDLRAAAGQLAADFEPDSATPSGNDDDRPVLGHGRHSWRRSLNA